MARTKCSAQAGLPGSLKPVVRPWLVRLYQLGCYTLEPNSLQWCLLKQVPGLQFVPPQTYYGTSISSLMRQQSLTRGQCNALCILDALFVEELRFISREYTRCWKNKMPAETLESKQVLEHLRCLPRRMPCLPCSYPVAVVVYPECLSSSHPDASSVCSEIKINCLELRVPEKAPVVATSCLRGIPQLLITAIRIHTISGSLANMTGMVASLSSVIVSTMESTRNSSRRVFPANPAKQAARIIYVVRHGAFGQVFWISNGFPEKVHIYIYIYI